MTENVLALLGKVSASALTVYIALARRARGTGQCFPSQDTLAADCGLSRRTVSAAIAELETEWIEVVRTKRPDGTWAPNIYRLPDISGWAPPEHVQNLHNNISKSIEPENGESRKRRPLAKSWLQEGYVGVLYGRPGRVPEETLDKFCPAPKVQDVLAQTLHDHNGSEFLIVDRQTGEVVAELEVERQGSEKVAQAA